MSDDEKQGGTKKPRATLSVGKKTSSSAVLSAPKTSRAVRAAAKNGNLTKANKATNPSFDGTKTSKSAGRGNGDGSSRDKSRRSNSTSSKHSAHTNKNHARTKALEPLASREQQMTEVIAFVLRENQRHEQAQAGVNLALILPCVVEVVLAVDAGRSLSDVLVSFVTLPTKQRAAIQDLSFTTMRYWASSRALVDRVASRELSAEVAGLLWVSLSLWQAKKYTAHALVDQTVAAAAMRVETEHAGGLVNAILRRVLREAAELQIYLNQEPAWVWNHPPWWIDLLQKQYPDAWQEILSVNNQTAPFVLRVNSRKVSLDDYLSNLEELEVPVVPLNEHALWLPQALPVERLPGFMDGYVSVQDFGAQKAADLLDVLPGMRVLDACAAPGGKTAHLLELVDCNVTAVDVDALRVLRINQNLERLHLQATVLTGDARKPEQWWDGVAFDRILADVPCSASGIVRRHPDIRWLRRSQDITQLSELQFEILCTLWGLLKPGGKLLYVTCSVFDAENQSVINRFLSMQNDAIQLPDGGQFLPTAYTQESAGHDGFFYAVLKKENE